jgi:hypothetical protein
MLHFRSRVARFIWEQHTKKRKNIRKDYKIQKIVPKDHKIYKMFIKHTEWPLNIPNVSTPRPSKMYKNWDFWYEKIPSGNPVSHNSLRTEGRKGLLEKYDCRNGRKARYSTYSKTEFDIRILKIFFR